MRRYFRIVIVAAALLAGCNSSINYVSQVKERFLHCEVDPDAVLGKHYTAADFQIWNLVSGSDVTELILNYEFPDTLFFSSGDRFDYTLVKECDTATVATALYPHCSRQGWYLMWGPWRLDGEVTDYQVLYLLVGKPLIDGTAVARAEAVEWKGRNEVWIDFEKEYHAEWQRITCESIGRCLAFRLGDRILMAPIVNGEISGGKSVVSNYFTEEECCALESILHRKS